MIDLVTVSDAILIGDGGKRGFNDIECMRFWPNSHLYNPQQKSRIQTFQNIFSHFFTQRKIRSLHKAQRLKILLGNLHNFVYKGSYVIYKFPLRSL